MNLEVGMYVRGNCDGIGRLIKYYNGEYEIAFKILRIASWGKLVLKASHNIIDLIEVGDYVNGFKVIDVEEKQGLLARQITLQNQWGITTIYDSYDVKSIVTKELYKAMEYEVEA